MAVDGSPEAPIAAVRVAPAEPVAAAAVVAATIAPAEVSPAPLSPEPVAAAIPIVEPAKVELVAERPSLLEKATDKPKAESDKPKPEPVKAEAAADKPKDGDVKPAEAKPEVKTEPKVEVKPEVKPGEKPADAEAAKPEALPAVEYKYTVPETLKMDDGLKGELGTALDAFRANPAEGAQGLIDLHAKTMADYAANLQTETLHNQHKAFNDTRDGWNKDWAADEQIGGSGYQTALKAIARMRDQFVSADVPGTPKYQADLKSFEEFLRITGAGDHPAFGRFLHNVAQAFDEPPLPPHNPQPLKNNGQRPGSRRERMYDHPSSSKTS